MKLEIQNQLIDALKSLSFALGMEDYRTLGLGLAGVYCEAGE
jgi:hypothetical protein